MKTKILILFLALAGLSAQAQNVLTYATNKDAITIIGYTGPNFGVTNVVIPASINGYPVVAIDAYAFYYTTLTSVMIGNNVTNIGNNAFGECPYLPSVIIPDSVTSISDYAFADCEKLTNVMIGNGVTSIGSDAFWSCDMTSVTIPDSVTNIGGSAFEACYKLTNVTIGNSVTSIGHDAFAGCSGLASIVIPDSVTSIGHDTFADCSSLTNIIVSVGNPDYSSVGGVLFDKNQTILIQFPGGIGGSFTIPDSVTNIGDSAFLESSLSSVIISDSVTSIGDSAFDSCISLPSVIIPDSVTSIGSDAFAGCQLLTNVTIGNGVTSIGDYAFQQCTSLTSVTIGNSVTNIEGGAFGFCSSLTNFLFQGNAPVLEDDDNEFIDDYVGASATVYYYSGTSGWGTTYGGLPTVELNAPSSPPQIGSSSAGVQAGGKFGFAITGVSSQTVVVEASTNLVNWQPIWTNTLSAASTNFTDSQWKNFPNRYYRAR